MSAQLYFSNSPALLLDRLSQNLDWSDPFRSPLIATPTPAMKRWVQMRLSEKRGIVANVRFLHLERTLWNRLEELDQEHVVEFRQPARLLDEQGLQLLILGLLRKHPPGEVRDYLEEDAAAEAAGARAGSGREALRSRRLCQLSLKLAGLFREYEYGRVQEHGRMGLAYLWKRGEDCFADYFGRGAPKEARAQVERLERWQKAVYHDLFRAGGLRDRLGESLGQYAYTLPQYAEMVLAQRRGPADPGGKPPSYHLFGLSQISPFHRSLIRRLSDREALPGRHAVFHIYSLNPCAEYWEDALDSKERRRLLQEDLFRRQKYLGWRQLTAEEKGRLRLEIAKIQEEELHVERWENPLLSQWGKLGRENIQLWNQQHGYEFEGHYQEKPPRNLLATVQDSILKRFGALPAEDRRRQDETLRIFACPEIHREVETAHQCIVEDLLQDPTLRPDEIAVLVPDMEKYRHVLAAVFDRAAPGEPGHVPHALMETSASAESEYARAARSLFALARGRFSRKEVFALAANPCFRHARGLDEESLRAWMRWSEGLNIFHGFDGSDKARRGYPAEEAHTWSHGLDRLALGTVMEAPPLGDPRHFEGLVPFADGSSPERALLQGFVAVIEGLHRDLAPFRETTGRAAAGRSGAAAVPAGAVNPLPAVPARPWGEWLDLLGSLLDTWLAVPDDEPLEAYVRAELRRYLGELRNMDALEGLLEKAPHTKPQESHRQPPPVPPETPMDLILARLDGLRAGRESQLFGGVQIAGLSALRSLPFRVIHILGLGEGEFPEDAATSTLDLRQYRRVIGDVDPAARNRYLFLEALVCAGEKLRLSYVSRDAQQGKTFQMSSVLNELVDYLEAGVLPPEGGKPTRFRSVQVPLLSRAPSLFSGEGVNPWDPPRNFSREERLLSWLEAKRKAFAEAGGGNFWDCLAAGLPERLKREVFPARGASETASGPVPAASAVVDVPLKDIAGFLKNPVEYTLHHHLRVNDWREDDASDLEDEPFFSGKAQERELLSRVFEARLADWDNPAADAARRDFDLYYNALAQRGFMPEGHYRTLDRELLWEKALGALGAMDGAFSRLREGGPAECHLNPSFGDGNRNVTLDPALSFPPVRLEGVAGRTVELHGHLPCLFRLPGGGCATLLALPHDLRLNRLLSPFLFYLAGLLSESRAGEWLRQGPFTIFYLHVQGEGFAVRKWPPFEIAPAAARAYLRPLLEAMLSGRDFDHLPFDLIVDALLEQKGDNKWEGRLAEGVDYAQALRDALDELDPSDRHPPYVLKESVKILGPEIPRDAETKVRARLGMFFNWA